MRESNRMGRWFTVAIAIALAIGAGVWYANQPRPMPVPPAAVDLDATPTPTPTPEPAIRHPIEDAIVEPPPELVEPEEPLPELWASDEALRADLAVLFGADRLEALRLNDALIQRFVATVDALPGDKVAAQIMPVQPLTGSLKVSGGAEPFALDPANYPRYAPYVGALEAVDTDALVGYYLRWYPRFQQAWRELGHVDGYFNDRLIEVIDHLLAAPPAPETVALVRPKVFYEFADDGLESRSAGHKLLLRMGPEQAATVKARLAAIRTALTGREPSNDESDAPAPTPG